MMNVSSQMIPSKLFSPISRYCRRAPCFARLHSSTDSSVEVCSQEHEVVVALGSNVGNRISNFNQALHMMKKSGIDIKRHGCLYETAPAYVTDQPKFLNSAIRGSTRLGPQALLGTLKKIERDMGRTDGIRYGPRPIDLDILFYGQFRVCSENLTIPHEKIVCSENLTIPHEKIWERPFVMAPLIDVLGSAIESDIVATWHSLSRLSGGLFEAWEKLGGESLVGKDGMSRVLPIGNHLWDWSQKTSVMGILNLTPDSFSDGGKYQSVENVVSQVRQMISDGADIIDFGAQSTRPMATRISPEEELDRLIPVLEAVREMPEAKGKVLSVDTFHAQVASEAVNNGAHIVNDVSGGQLDSSMLSVVAGLEVPYITMHMRGDPATMQNKDNLQYDDVCKQVAFELNSRVREAESMGIPAWRIIIDPGIGFSKNTQHNLDLLVGLTALREEIGKSRLAVSHGPLLIGPSRKRFLGDICNRPVAADRDPATIASVTAGVLNGANIVRVHNVRDSLDAVKLSVAMLERKRDVTRVSQM